MSLVNIGLAAAGLATDLTTDGATDGATAGTGNGSGYTPNITINWDYFPFMGPLIEAVGGFQALGIVLMVMSVIGAASIWVVGHWFDLGHRGTQAKLGIAAAFVGGAVIGGSAELVGFFAEAGSNF
ncbi:hypothetical protein CWT12_01600 [Actinomyces sp. 432]|uniref:hypothetical protein n=1 Tax=Actinomyces sp. 432 TaxID=2057798 RepID=UPI0013745FD4|nr:hypothetical protein [Actinomyces sp. 432]QHO90295.1 hypothetical protein CWT12_01600 [Actinomyces sp. 432]